MIDLLISAAHAADVAVGGATSAVAAGQPSALAGALPLILIAVVFYFLIIRPQMKRQKDHLKLVEGLKRGDKVVTSGGIVGVVMKVDTAKDLLHVEVAEGVNVKVVRSMVYALIEPKSEVTKGGNKQAKESSDESDEQAAA